MDSYPAATGTVHPTNEMEVAIDSLARKPSITPAVTEGKPAEDRVWGLAARVTEGVTFEEYTYWAKVEREMEREEQLKFRAEHGSYPLLDLIKGKFSSEGRAKQKDETEDRAHTLQSVIESSHPPVTAEKKATDEVVTSSPPSEDANSLRASDAEWRTAARAMRTASWGQMFFLITTDILGWSGAP